MEEVSRYGIQYTGPVALNTRGIRKAYQTIEGRFRDAEGEEKSLDGQPMDLDELVNLLSFVEACVMANRVYYDGTVPPDDVEEIAGYAESLRGRVGKDLSISAIEETDAYALYVLCKEAAEQASLLTYDLTNEELATTKTDRPVAGDISSFLAYVERDYGGDTEQAVRDRADAALAIVTDVVAGRRTFRGSKCVAGLLAAEFDGPDPVDHVRNLLKGCRSEVEKRVLIGALINRFRINYINALSSQDQYEAAYLATPSIESLKSQQIVHLTRYLFQRIRDQHRQLESDDLADMFNSQHRALPIGWAVLMRAERGKPLSLFEKALCLRDPVFNAMAASKTPQFRHVHAFDPEGFEALEDELLFDLYAEIDEGLPRKEKRSAMKYVSSRIPAVLGAGAGAGLAAFLTQFMGPVLAAMSGQTAAVMAEEGLRLTVPTDKFNVYVDHFQYLKGYYEGALKHSSAGLSTARQVERVFGRPLLA